MVNEFVHLFHEGKVHFICLSAHFALFAQFAVPNNSERGDVLICLDKSFCQEFRQARRWQIALR